MSARTERNGAFASAAAFVLLAACGARTDISSATSEPASAAPASTPTADEPTQYDAPQDACMTSSRATHAYSSEADLQSLLIGRWMLCNPGTPNPYWSAESVGLDLLADGLAYPLFRTSGTQISRGGGEYVWRYRVVLNQGASFEMVFEGGGNPTFSSQMGDDPRKLAMDDGHKKFAFAPAQ